MRANIVSIFISIFFSSCQALYKIQNLR